jgi:RecA/RadA recombinase
MEVQRYPRIFTGLVEVDLLFCPTIGSCIEINGDQSQGKSTLSYVMAGTLLRTCRLCNTLAVAWVDEETGEVVETCRCGKNQFMTGVIADIERSCDPIWMDIWGCRLGTGFEEKTRRTGGFRILVPKGRKANLHIIRPRAGGALYTFLQRVLETGAKDFVIIDSMNSVISDEALGKAAGQRNVADRARMNWDGLRRLAAAQLETENQFGSHPTVIWTNHRIMDIGAKRPRRVEAGGGGPRIFADQRIQFTYTKKNQGKDDLPFTAFIDTHFGVTKNKAGLPDGASGTFRLYTNSVEMNRIPFYPGDTDDAEKSYTVLKDLGLFEEKKSKYIVLGRTFKRVAEVKAFLSREDIKMECRFWLGIFMMSTTARAHLRFEDYCYSPFESTRRYYEQTFEEVEKKAPGLCLGVALSDEPTNLRALEEIRRRVAKEEAETEAGALVEDLLED